MDYSNVTREMFNIFKSSAEATFGTISTLQNQTERMANLLLDQAGTLQSEGRKHLQEWLASTKKSQEELKTAYTKGMNSITEILSSKGMAEDGDAAKKRK